MLKGIKKKWTDITIALALPLVIWNGVTGIYNQWEEVQDEKDVPRMIAEQRYGDMLFVWHIWCDDATVGNLIEGYPPSPAVTYACRNIPPIDMPYEEFYNARVNSKYADQLPFSVDPAKDVITQRSAKQTELQLIIREEVRSAFEEMLPTSTGGVVRSTTPGDYRQEVPK